MRYRSIPGALAVASVVIAGSLAGCSSSSGSVKIGAILDLSGPGATLGQATKAALTAAVADFSGKGLTLTLEVKDSGSDPARAEAAIEALKGDGVSIVVGPQTSSEAKAILPYADENGMLVISNGSTAGALSIAGDALYRVLPNDGVEGRASADLLVSKGATKVVVAHRDDAGNSGLASSITRILTAAGVEVVGIPAYPGTGTDAAAVAASLVAAFDGAGGASSTSVYLAGYGDVAPILAAAKGSSLEGALVTGGDGSAKSGDLLADAATVAFAATVYGYPTPLPAIGADAVAAPASLTAAVKDADPLAYAAYDAVGIVVKALTAAGTGATGAALRSAFQTAADGYAGVSGVVRLDPSGDRISQPFAFWGVCGAGAPAWKVVGTWAPPASGTDAGSATLTGC